MPATADELDFWSDNIKVDVLTPLMILRAQEPALRKKTKGILQAKVESVTTETAMIHNLYLIAPALGSYKEKIVSVKHKPNLVYPCSVEADAAFRPARHQLPSSVGSAIFGSERTAASQVEFVELLKEALISPAVRSAINSLLAKSNEIQVEQSGHSEPAA